MDRVCLVIIFNYRFDGNIPKLRKIYGGRFKNIRFLVPFYDGDDLDVIPVYESLFQFQGYFIQAYEKLSVLDCEYYLFIGDDLILNPSISEDNFKSFLNIDSESVIISDIGPLNSKGMFGWIHSRYCSSAFVSRSTEYYLNLLPSYAEAGKLYEAFMGKELEVNYTSDFYEGYLDGETHEEHDEAIRQFKKKNRGNKMPYPLVYTYSDFLCVKKDRLYELSYCFGIFAAMNLYVEIAIPTAIMLHCKREEVKCLPEIINRAGGQEQQFLLIWDEEERKQIANKYHHSLRNVYDNWNSWIFIHPIKLSEWDVDL